MRDCSAWSYQSIWNTREVAETLRAKRQAAAAKRDGTEGIAPTANAEEWPDEYPYGLNVLKIEKKKQLEFLLFCWYRLVYVFFCYICCIFL